MKGAFRTLCGFLLGIALLLLAGEKPAHAVPDESALEIAPEKIEVNSFYHGTRLRVEGTAPSRCEVVVVISGEETEHSLNRKGKVGPLWMTVGTLTIKGAPEVYYLLTSANNREVPALPEILTTHGMGYDAMRKGVVIEGDDSDFEAAFDEFVRLKVSMGLYQVSLGAISLESGEQDTSRFALTVPIPPMIPPGNYDVRLYCFDERQLASNTSRAFSVKKVGLPLRLSELAFEHAAMYGIISIIIAMAAGLLMGLLFGSKKKEPH